MRVHAFLLDADGCLYNQNYFEMLALVINQFGDFFEKYHNRQKLSEKQAAHFKEEVSNILAFAQSLSVRDLKNPISSHPFFIKKRDEVIELNQKMKLNVGFQTAMFRLTLAAFSKFMNQIEPKILTTLLFKANEKLFSFMKNKINDEKIDGIIFGLGSNRQSYKHDQNGIDSFGSGSIFEDLYHLRDQLQTLFPDKKIAVSPFCMSDSYGNLERGESFKKMLSPNKANLNHADYIFDETKGSIIYGFSHDLIQHYSEDLGVERSASDVISLDFLDDREDILLSLKQLYELHQNLLPKLLKELNLYEYRGHYHPVYKDCIYGLGVLDRHYERNIKLMTKLCTLDNRVWDMTQQLKVNDFLSSRVTGWEIKPWSFQHTPSLLFAKEKPTWLANEEAVDLKVTAERSSGNYLN